MSQQVRKRKIPKIILGKKARNIVANRVAKINSIFRKLKEASSVKSI